MGGGIGSSSSAALGGGGEGSSMDMSMIGESALGGLEELIGFAEELCTVCYVHPANTALQPCDHKICAECVKELKKRAVMQVSENIRIRTDHSKR